jgi:hypothetical protein
MPRSLTAFLAISLRRDGLTTFFLEPPIRSRPLASPQDTSS